MRSTRILLAALLAATVTGVGTASAATSAAPRLKDPHACLDFSGKAQQGFTCYTLRVPLDHTGRTRGTLDLQVGAADNTHARLGTLLFLTGGPGQPGVTFLTRMTQRMPQVFKDYRLVMIDQRGTGQRAINCPELQAQVGSSDIAVPTRAAIDQCSSILGRDARFYDTDQTVGDIDSFRRALGLRKMVVDGVSYGTFTAQRYAVAHPHNVARLVLDSVLPFHEDPSASLYLDGEHAEARVLRDACTAAPKCGYDPARDLAWVVRHRTTAQGVTLFDTIVSYEFLDPTYRSPKFKGGIITALHNARHGDPSLLDYWIGQLNAADGTPPADFSAGLHAATLCSDQGFPWGNASTPVAARPKLLARYMKKVSPAAVWPYTKAVAQSQGLTAACLPWPAEPADSNPGGLLPRVPTLFVNGSHDLSTPLEWAREAFRRAPGARFVVVPGASHSIQNREQGTVGRDAVTAFLTDLTK
jgi:pimeloyl-ACP methyl ester carboxylesterase